VAHQPFRIRCARRGALTTAEPWSATGRLTLVLKIGPIGKYGGTLFIGAFPTGLEAWF
jgi:hypothetical protein